MKPNLVCLLVAAVLPCAVSAQAIMEHAAAAAGATVGTAGGKALSNLIDKTLNKAAAPEADAAKSTAKTAPAATPPNAAATTSPNPAAAPSASTPAATKRSRAPRQPAAPVAKPAPDQSLDRALDQTLDHTLDQGLAAPVFAVAPVPSIEDFAKVKEGGARQDVFAALGTPSSHITIPDDGHLIEIMTYSDGRRRLGSVRLDNGQVVSISTAP
jgi:hypothetical protein